MLYGIIVSRTVILTGSDNKRGSFASFIIYLIKLFNMEILKEFNKDKNNKLIKFKSPCNFDFNGHLIFEKGYHPIIIIFTDSKVYYLNARSKYGQGDIKVHYNESANLHNSYINPRSVQIMDKDIFEKYYNVSLLGTNKDLFLPDTEAKKVYDKILRNLNDNKLTIQKIDVVDDTPQNSIIYTYRPREQISDHCKNKETFDNNSPEAKETLLALDVMLNGVKEMSEEEFHKFNNTYETLASKNPLEHENIEELEPPKMKL